MTQKTIDTLKMVRQIRDVHHHKRQGATVAERLAYYKQ